MRKQSPVEIYLVEIFADKINEYTRKIYQLSENRYYYIGQTTKTSEERLQEHIKNSDGPRFDRLLHTTKDIPDSRSLHILASEIKSKDLLDALEAICVEQANNLVPDRLLNTILTPHATIPTKRKDVQKITSALAKLHMYLMYDDDLTQNITEALSSERIRALETSLAYALQDKTELESQIKKLENQLSEQRRQTNEVRETAQKEVSHLYFGHYHQMRDRKLSDILNDGEQMVMLADPKRSQYCLLKTFYSWKNNTFEELIAQHHVLLELSETDTGRRQLEDAYRAHYRYSSCTRWPVRDMFKTKFPLFEGNPYQTRPETKYTPLEFMLVWFEAWSSHRCGLVLTDNPKALLDMLPDIRIDTIPKIMFDDDDQIIASRGLTQPKYDWSQTKEYVRSMMTRERKYTIVTDVVVAPEEARETLRFAAKTQTKLVWKHTNEITPIVNLSEFHEFADEADACYVPSEINVQMHRFLGTNLGEDCFIPMLLSDDSYRQELPEKIDAHALWTVYGMPNSDLKRMPYMSNLDALIIHEMMRYNPHYTKSVAKFMLSDVSEKETAKRIANLGPWPQAILQDYEDEFSHNKYEE